MSGRIDVQAIGQEFGNIQTLQCDVMDRENIVPVHVFYPGRMARPEQSPLLYVHRNGHGSMIAKTEDGRWRLCKYWKEPSAVEQAQTAFIKDDLHEIYDMISVGMGESLTFVPKEITGRRRLVVFREHLLGLQWGGSQEQFSLSFGDGARLSPQFTGKVWESSEAVEWCDANLDTFRKAKLMGARQAKVREIVQRRLEDSPIYGIC